MSEPKKKDPSTGTAPADQQPKPGGIITFKPEDLRIGPDFAASVGVKKMLRTVLCRKPHPQEWLRTHPGEDYRLLVAMLELKAGQNRDVYLVAPQLAPDLGTEISPRMLFTTVTRQGVVFLWPVKVAGPDGRIDNWSRSALDAAQLAMGRWVRVMSNMNLGAYEVFEASASIPEPTWPELPFPELLRLAFAERFIDSLNHPVLAQLRGAQ